MAIRLLFPTVLRQVFGEYLWEFQVELLIDGTKALLLLSVTKGWMRTPAWHG
jgi:hypothetical protein